MRRKMFVGCICVSQHLPLCVMCPFFSRAGVRGAGPFPVSLFSLIRIMSESSMVSPTEGSAPPSGDDTAALNPIVSSTAAPRSRSRSPRREPSEPRALSEVEVLQCDLVAHAADHVRALRHMDEAWRLITHVVRSLGHADGVPPERPDASSLVSMDANPLFRDAAGSAADGGSSPPVER